MNGTVFGLFEDAPPTRMEHFEGWFRGTFGQQWQACYPDFVLSVVMGLHAVGFEAHEAELHPFLDGHNAVVVPKCDCPIRRGWV